MAASATMSELENYLIQDGQLYLAHVGAVFLLLSPSSEGNRLIFSGTSIQTHPAQKPFQGLRKIICAYNHIDKKDLQNKMMYLSTSLEAVFIAI